MSALAEMPTTHPWAIRDGGVVGTICAAFAKGASDAAVAAKAGVSRAVLLRLLDDGRTVQEVTKPGDMLTEYQTAVQSFYTAVVAAQASFDEEALGVVVDDMRNVTSKTRVSSAKWLLEKRSAFREVAGSNLKIRMPDGTEAEASTIEAMYERSYSE